MYKRQPLGPPVTPRSSRSKGFPRRNQEYTWQRMPEQQQLAKKAGEGRGRSKAEKEAAAEAERRRKEWAKQKVAEIRAARQAPISSATDITADRAKNFRQEVKDVQRLWKREQNLKKVTELKGEAQKALEGGDLLGATRKQVDAKLMRDATNLYTTPKEDWQATERAKAQREARQTLADMEKAEKAEKNRRRDTRSARKAAQQGDVDKVLEAQARAQSEKVRADRQKTIQALSDDSNQLNLLDTDEAQRKLQTERTKQVELASKRDRHRKAAETLEKRGERWRSGDEISAQALVDDTMKNIYGRGKPQTKRAMSKAEQDLAEGINQNLVERTFNRFQKQLRGAGTTALTHAPQDEQKRIRKQVKDAYKQLTTDKEVFAQSFVGSSQLDNKAKRLALSRYKTAFEERIESDLRGPASERKEQGRKAQVARRDKQAKLVACLLYTSPSPRD